ncbi:hypothetical protein Skr01_31140 [Sphaerisporangium krabiense]|nr:hypothetical protein Skr01_31140 [Sphaerisporangium krabiense]
MVPFPGPALIAQISTYEQKSYEGNIVRGEIADVASLSSGAPAVLSMVLTGVGLAVVGGLLGYRYVTRRRRSR